MKITGNSLYLRELQLEDADGNYPNWLNDPVVCKYNSHGDINYTKEMAIEYINFVNNSLAHKVFAICVKKTDKHIGNVALQQISKNNKSAEFAIILGEEEFMGKGLSKEASKLILNYGFNQLNLNRIYCGTSVNNLPMQKLAISLGMSEEGIARESVFKNGKFLDVINYGILKVDNEKE